MPGPVALPFPIPDAILLLLHLHLLQCPLEELQLGPDTFTTSYGIGERLKAMERIFYFLISKAEGEVRAKTMLPMHPSSKPAELAAFKSAVIKYLESLRANALKPQPKPALSSAAKSTTARSSPSSTTTQRKVSVKPTLPSSRPFSSTTSRSVSTSTNASTSSRATSTTMRSVSTATTADKGAARVVSSTASNRNVSISKASASSKAGSPAINQGEFIAGWWWKDVPVRKSLLEECAGPKFEKLLLALSIHALFASQAREAREDDRYIETLRKFGQASNLELFEVLKEQPEEYMELIRRIKSLQAKMATEKDELAAQKRAISKLKTAGPTSSIGTSENVEELRRANEDFYSRIKELDPDYQDALQYLFAISGIYSGRADPTASNGEGSQESLKRKARPSARATILAPPPLPTVAAHHPSHLSLLSALEASISDLRTASPNEDLANESTQAAKNAEEGQDTGIYAQLIHAESGLASSLKQFKKELELLDRNIERELELVEAALEEAYQHDDAAGSGMKSRVSEFVLEFEMPSAIDGLEALEGLVFASTLSLEEEVAKLRESSHVDEQQESSSEEEELGIPAEEAAEVPSSAVDSDEEVEWVDQTVLDAEVTLLASPAKSLSRSIRRSPTKSPAKTIAILQSPERSPGKTRIPSWSNTTPRHARNIFASPNSRTPGRLDRTPKARNEKRSPHRSPFSTPKRGKTFTSINYSPSRSRHLVGATPSFFLTPSKGQEQLKDILPPFTSPWRSVNRSQTWREKSPRKSGRYSFGKPRISSGRPRVSDKWATPLKATGPRLSKGKVVMGSGFVRTPLKSGRRLSNIIPPVSYAPAFAPRESLDDVYEEVVDDLVQSASHRTPPQMSPSRRLFDSRGAVERTTPFKSLAQSRSIPIDQSPEVDRKDVFSPQVGDWEDFHEDLEQTPNFRSTAQRPKPRKSEGFRRKSRRSTVHFLLPEDHEEGKEHRSFTEGQSFTVRDILLKVGEDGMMGVNGTFNFDLMQEAELEDQDDSILAGL